MLSSVTPAPFLVITPMLESQYGTEKSTTLARSSVRVVSTVRVPALTGLTLMLSFLLVTLQSPKSPPDALDEESLDPHPAMETASASAMASVDIRFRCMERSPLFP